MTVASLWPSETATPSAASAAIELEGAGQLRRDRHDPQAIAQRLEVGLGDVARASQVLRAMRTLPLRAQERPLQVEPERLRPVAWRVGQPAADVARESMERRDRGAHRGRKEGRHPVSGERPGHARKRVGAIHRVVAAPAVDVDVDEPGRHVGPGRPSLVRLDRRDPVTVDPHAPGHHLVLEDEPPDDLRRLRHRCPPR